MEKQRVIQEYVPGKQITLAHVIAKPPQDLCDKMGFPEAFGESLGILTITPGEGAILAGDLATKSGRIALCYVDRFSGSVVVRGEVAAVESALKAVVSVLSERLAFAGCQVTRT
jgi:ethanolamine utilization protein EutS